MDRDHCSVEEGCARGGPTYRGLKEARSWSPTFFIRNHLQSLWGLQEGFRLWYYVLQQVPIERKIISIFHKSHLSLNATIHFYQSGILVQRRVLE